ncbi:cofactor-independent phosphoglycerate mutase [Candidatus Magnetominusculus dajiuhuensis]|uniref:cofactor-independent phosphoglycerate mutase n=1 Tax=Candidatus Magnetominusculus dajiuhuensis TaxID=3137712 RepID=UPI003B42A913
MKYIVLIGDGMADMPLEAIGAMTPLQKAATPNMDSLASGGTVGMVRTVPEGFPPGSDVANLSILGYDPRQYYCGRAPLEAASMGVSLDKGDAAFRCNLVCLDFAQEETLMADYSSGHITSEEAKVLITAVNKGLADDKIHFYPGISYRHLMVWKDGPVDMSCTPPHDITGKPILSYLPNGESSCLLLELMSKSQQILKGHPVNIERMRLGKPPANSIWLWGQGKRPDMPLFKAKYGIEGSLISAVDLTKGLGVCAGLRVIDVPGATGYLDTNYTGKARYGVDSLNDRDFVYIHVEAPDEAGHSGRLADKIRAIEDFDSLVVGEVLRLLKGMGDYKILLMPDHPTPIALKTHTNAPVPFVIYDSRNVKTNNISYDEGIASLKDADFIGEGHTLMSRFIKHF